MIEQRSDHRIDPSPGSPRRKDGRPADLLNPLHYPVIATCRTCGRAIWEDRMMFSDWVHLPDPGQDGS